MKLIVTIDTEADNQWAHGRPLSTRNVDHWGPFQELCERYGILPTYLITSEIATDPKAVGFLRPLVEADKAEVGAHLHPWTTPPYGNQPGLGFNDPVHAFPSELPPDLLYDKLETLTGQVANALGRRPTSFRAGRFGFDSVCAGMLKQLGYIVDSSVTPLVSWKKTLGYRGGGPDFSGEKAYPFWVACPNGDRLLEMPITILCANRILDRMPSLQPVYRLLQRTQSNRLISLNRMAPQPLWMRPFRRTTSRDLIACWKAAERFGLQTAVMMFHSSELMPAASIHRPDQASVEHLMGMLEELVKFASSEYSAGETLTKAAISVAAELRGRDHLL
jgi:hypothetical protein